MKQTVVFDFDGVIHSYTSGWLGVTNIPDPPVPGIKEAIAEIRAAGYEVVVVSTRTADVLGFQAVRAWLMDNDIEVDRVCAEKPPAIVYIDDRAICFDGNPASLLDKIRRFEPWNRKVVNTSTELILNGDKGALIYELHDVIKWARNLSEKEWDHITHDTDNGLLGFVTKVVEGQLVRDQ